MNLTPAILCIAFSVFICTMRLESAFPQPARQGHPISVDVAIARRMSVRIVLTDILGRLVDCEEDALLEPGTHRMQLHAPDLPPGLYICTLSGDGAATRQPILVVP
jgi:hypothetical protein